MTKEQIFKKAWKNNCGGITLIEEHKDQLMRFAEEYNRYCLITAKGVSYTFNEVKNLMTNGESQWKVNVVRNARARGVYVELIQINKYIIEFLEEREDDESLWNRPLPKTKQHFQNYLIKRLEHGNKSNNRESAISTF